MEAVNFSLPSTETADSDKKFQHSFWRWYEKLATFCAQHLAKDWTNKDCQDPDNWPYF